MSVADILIVDDEASVLRAIQRLLASETDWTVETTTDPAAVIDRLGECPPRVLVTDYRMPEIDGLDVLREARRVAPSTIRILLTGESDRSHIIDAINEGRIFRYVAKPWRNDALLDLLREALTAHAAHGQRSSLERSVADATAVQRYQLPESPATGDAAIFFSPFEYASGDYLDAIDLAGGRTALVMGDVCGHGMRAAYYVAAVRALLRSGLTEGDELGTVLARTNRFLCSDMQEDRFVTLFVGIYDADRELLTYANAGHSAPLVARRGEVEVLDRTALPLGLDDSAPFGGLAQTALGPGDTLLAYTDGLVEARNAASDLFGLDRLVELLGACTVQTADDVLHRVGEGVRSFAGSAEIDDDLSLLAFRPRAAQPTPA